jgi:hypothetical protein
MAGCGKDGGGSKQEKATKGTGKQGSRAASGGKGGTVSKGGTASKSSACGRQAASGKGGFAKGG